MEHKHETYFKIPNVSSGLKIFFLGMVAEELYKIRKYILLSYCFYTLYQRMIKHKNRMYIAHEITCLNLHEFRVNYHNLYFNVLLDFCLLVANLV